MKERIIEQPRTTTLAEYGRHQILRYLAVFSELSFASRFFRGFAWWIVVLIVLLANPAAIIRNRNRQRTSHRAPLLMSVTRECAAPFYRALAAVLLKPAATSERLACRLRGSLRSARPMLSVA